jgi:hypothetical protein
MKTTSELQKYAEQELAKGRAIRQAEVDEKKRQGAAHNERIVKSSAAFNSLFDTACKALLSVGIQLGVDEGRTDTNGHACGKLYVKSLDGRDSVLGHVCVTDNDNIDLYSFDENYEHTCDVPLAEATLLVIKRAAQVYTRG